MRYKVGSRILHPETGREGLILRIYRNPACLMRIFVIEWDDGNVDEVEELEFGPLEDD